MLSASFALFIQSSDFLICPCMSVYFPIESMNDPLGFSFNPKLDCAFCSAVSPSFLYVSGSNFKVFIATFL